MGQAKLGYAVPWPALPRVLDRLGHRLRVALQHRDLVSVATQERSGRQATHSAPQHDYSRDLTSPLCCRRTERPGSGKATPERRSGQPQGV